MSKKNLRWWASVLHRTLAPIHRAEPTITMFTDACGYGWGAIVGDARAQGHFLPFEQHYSINTQMSSYLLQIQEFSAYFFAGSMS